MGLFRKQKNYRAEQVGEAQFKAFVWGYPLYGPYTRCKWVALSEKAHKTMSGAIDEIAQHKAQKARADNWRDNAIELD